jgi:predicted short-subunit dehydrogenase-like oxidoreductase (DUF2520 family)
MTLAHHYLLIGNGRVAKHMQHYFSLLGICFSTWHRGQSHEALQQRLNQATHILLLISDQHIEEFITTHLNATQACLIHFSGSLVSRKAYGAHPLMTFNQELYSLERYQHIPFVIDHSAPEFNILLPGLSNVHVRLHTALKAKYHALCVLSGNFSCLLWQKLLSGLEELNIPAEIAHSYLEQQTQNIVKDPKTALTGPLTRDDHLSIEKNLAALAGDPFQKVYASFVECYEKIKPRKPHEYS